MMLVTASDFGHVYSCHHGWREDPDLDKQGNDMTALNKNDMTDLNKKVGELNDAELDAVSGGNLVDAVVQVVKTATQVITSNTGKCTDHWYSE